MASCSLGPFGLVLHLDAHEKTLGLGGESPSELQMTLTMGYRFCMLCPWERLSHSPVPLQPYRPKQQTQPTVLPAS